MRLPPRIRLVGTVSTWTAELLLEMISMDEKPYYCIIGKCNAALDSVDYKTDSDLHQAKGLCQNCYSFSGICILLKKWLSILGYSYILQAHPSCSQPFVGIHQDVSDN
jgi:hypothetical protein